ncbi:hypothetical protein G4B88_015928 [Cannabis sativa]|uniref:Uncharacterized protein n=1 Tax=Cannabis sativa TaxID=3483 RepID=A0A7J6EJF7_CANSA|nr:hypothetical protein G4B88_015928 [Cannabis sativa]
MDFISSVRFKCPTQLTKRTELIIGAYIEKRYASSISNGEPFRIMDVLPFTFSCVELQMAIIVFKGRQSSFLLFAWATKFESSNYMWRRTWYQSTTRRTLTDKYKGSRTPLFTAVTTLSVEEGRAHDIAWLDFQARSTRVVGALPVVACRPVMGVDVYKPYKISVVGCNYEMGIIYKSIFHPFYRWRNGMMDESLLCQGLALNDDLQRLLAKHEAISSGTLGLVIKSKPESLGALVDVEGPLVDTGDSSERPDRREIQGVYKSTEAYYPNIRVDSLWRDQSSRKIWNLERRASRKLDINISTLRLFYQIGAVSCRHGAKKHAENGFSSMILEEDCEDLKVASFGIKGSLHDSIPEITRQLNQQIKNLFRHTFLEVQEKSRTAQEPKKDVSGVAGNKEKAESKGPTGPMAHQHSGALLEQRSTTTGITPMAGFYMNRSSERDFFDRNHQDSQI